MQWKFVLDMMTPWSSLFIFLFIEIFLCSALILPGVPATLRRRLLQLLKYMWNDHPRFRIVMKTALVIITGLFLDSLRRMVQVEFMMHSSTAMRDSLNVGRHLDFDLAFFQAEKNAFLCGTCVFFWMMLYRFQAMYGEVAALEEKIATLSKGGVPESELEPTKMTKIEDVENTNKTPQGSPSQKKNQ